MLIGAEKVIYPLSDTIAEGSTRGHLKMICNKCGGILDEDRTYCVKCGAQLQSRPDSGLPPEREEQRMKDEVKEGKKMWIYAVIAGALSIVLSPLIAGVMILMMIDKNTGLINMILDIASLSGGILGIYYGLKGRGYGNKLWLIGTILGTIGILIVVGLFGLALFTA